MKRIYGLLLLILVLLLTACGKSTEEKWQEQYDLGMQYLIDGDYEAAIVAFTTAIEIDPNRTPAYIGRGDSYILSGATEENLTLAQADYEMVLDLDETVQEAYLGLSDISVLREDYDGALDILKDGLEKAEETEKILERIPETLQEYYDLALAWMDEEDYETAIAILTKIIDFINEIDMDDEALQDLLIDAYISRGDAYAKSGDTEENLSLAMADYLAALELDETVAKAYLGIADVYIRQGDYDSALEILWEGLEKAGNPEEIEEKIEEIEAGNIRDSSGNLRRMSSYDETGALMWYHEYNYNADGTEASVTSYDSSGTQTGHVDKVYDENGNVLVSCWYYADKGTLDRMELKYDASGNCVQEVMYEAGEVRDILAYEYDAQGNQISYLWYDGEGELLGSAAYEYNDLGQEIKDIRYDADGNLSGYYTIEYNGDGEWSRLNYYGTDGKLYWTNVYQYDSDGNYLGYDRYDGEGNLTQSLTGESN